MGINFEINILNKEEFLDLVNDLKQKIKEVEIAMDKINNFELELNMNLINRKGDKNNG